jgi:hypothetical protein
MRVKCPLSEEQIAVPFFVFRIESRNIRVRKHLKCRRKRYLSLLALHHVLNRIINLNLSRVYWYVA